MFVSTSHTINTIGMHLLVQFAQGRFNSDSYATEEDLTTALLQSPTTELQQQIYDWFSTAKTNVDALIFGYVAKFSLSMDDIEQSLLPGLAADLMRYELCTNDADEGISKRRDNAIKQLEKIDKGVIQLKSSTPKLSSKTIKTIKPASQFNWSGY
ncbi:MULTISPECIES: phage protein Gp36 family protein [Pseudoalteromonas]|uniref:DUF1320 domain-containing protein n=1 Tax=Pseudoalteromonas amylolytica TaxID=1859457 RepID=A0A1S1MSQ5_9GAMM|nr:MULTISPECIES: phage protein Gp36 family protein [Pseudoalteromonas]OHU85523.1 hypothetical protein BFC16_19435 [Pseudoalteromonas sp. JW3]OHU91757.1 hypothetical protein BET10_08130 [Pseudoalteromonas amylolytica]